jgi:hypothetical protein
MRATSVVEVTGEFEDYEDEDGNTQERLKEGDGESYLRWECEDCGYQEREDHKDDDEQE